MLRNEHFELHKILKERIKGKIFVGYKGKEVTINIVGFKGTTWQLTINDMENVNEMADLIERKYHNFVMNRFFVRNLKERFKENG